MASFERRGNGWRADVNMKGVRDRATFPTKAEAQAWALKRENEIKGGNGIQDSHSVTDLYRQYVKLVSPKKENTKWEENRLEYYIREYPELAAKKLRDVTSNDFAELRDARLKINTGSTVARDLNLLSNVFQVAKKEWKWISASPISDVSRPEEGEPRQRRVEAEDIRRLLLAMNYEPGEPIRTTTQRVALIFLFAMETGMRSGEICRITWADVDFLNSIVLLPKTKNKTKREVPLSEEAEGIIRIMEPFKDDTDNRVFRMSIRQRDALFRKARNKTGLLDLKFHDTRREGLSRLADIFENPMDLAKISGHKDLKILLNTYYAPKAAEMAKKLRAAKQRPQ